MPHYKFKAEYKFFDDNTVKIKRFREFDDLRDWFNEHVPCRVQKSLDECFFYTSLGDMKESLESEELEKEELERATSCINALKAAGRTAGYFLRTADGKEMFLGTETDFKYGELDLFSGDFCHIRSVVGCM